MANKHENWIIIIKQNFKRIIALEKTDHFKFKLRNQNCKQVNRKSLR